MPEPRQAFTFKRYWGKYYVLYPDGAKSMCMSKTLAEDYSEIFGGTVHRHESFPLTRWEKLKLILMKRKNNYASNH